VDVPKVVRKPPGKEPAGSWGQRCRTLYGDFDVAVEDAAADEVAGRAMAEPDGGGNAAWVARQEEADADPSFAGSAGYTLGRTPTVLVLDQRDRSALQGRMMLAGLMRCRS
jgi:hypothetical protein